jgi:8-oxo-dGTP diphosphatase
MENPALPVVCALIERDSRVLLAQRPAHKHLALKWEFPGGKIDPGETAEAALIREIREELLCEVAIRRALPRFRHTYDRTTIEMIPFVCSLTPESPEPQPAEHAAIAWVLPSELAAYDLAAADRPVVRMYQAGAGKTTC